MEELRKVVQQLAENQREQAELGRDLATALDLTIYLLKVALDPSGGLKSALTSQQLHALQERVCGLRDKFSRLESGLVSLQHELI